MAVVEMSITRALTELTLLDARIRSTISASNFSTYKKASSPKVLNGRKTVEEFKAEAKASYQSINDLIKRREQIKSLIVASNAVTKVTIGGIEYTVAGAIETKNSIEYKKILLAEMKRSLQMANSKVQMANDKMEADIMTMNNTYLSADKTKGGDIPDSMKAMNDTYRKDNITELIDPLDIENEIKNLEEFITTFEAECDFTLSEINAVTKIKVED